MSITAAKWLSGNDFFSFFHILESKPVILLIYYITSPETLQDIKTKIKNRGAAEVFVAVFVSRKDEGEVCIIFKSCYLKTEDPAEVSGVSHGRRIHLARG